MASVKELVSSVKVLWTFGKTKLGFLQEHANCIKVCFVNGLCLDVNDLSEWVLFGMIFIWIGWANSLLNSENRDMSGYTSWDVIPRLRLCELGIPAGPQLSCWRLSLPLLKAHKIFYHVTFVVYGSFHGTFNFYSIPLDILS